MWYAQDLWTLVHNQASLHYLRQSLQCSIFCKMFLCLYLLLPRKHKLIVVFLQYQLLVHQEGMNLLLIDKNQDHYIDTDSYHHFAWTQSSLYFHLFKVLPFILLSCWVQLTLSTLVFRYTLPVLHPDWVLFRLPHYRKNTHQLLPHGFQIVILRSHSRAY